MADEKMTHGEARLLAESLLKLGSIYQTLVEGLQSNEALERLADMQRLWPMSLDELAVELVQESWKADAEATKLEASAVEADTQAREC